MVFTLLALIKIGARSLKEWLSFILDIVVGLWNASHLCPFPAEVDSRSSQIKVSFSNRIEASHER